MIKNLDILFSKRFFLDLVSLGKVRQGVSSSISLLLTIIDFKVVLQEFLTLMDLTRTQTFCIYKSSEVIMVNKDEDLIFIAF